MSVKALIYYQNVNTLLIPFLQALPCFRYSGVLIVTYKVPIYLIVDISKLFCFQEWKVHMFTPFTPTAEAPGVRDPFLTHYPYNAAKMGVMASLPLITSVTSEEGLYPAAGKLLLLDMAQIICRLQNKYLLSNACPCKVASKQAALAEELPTAGVNI